MQVITLATILRTQKPLATLPQLTKSPTIEVKTALLEYKPPINATELEQKRILDELNLK